MLETIARAEADMGATEELWPSSLNATCTASACNKPAISA